jgi:asparagine synthase (glutamine-hydrolysing)
MCGLCGLAWLDASRSPDPELLRQAARTLVHRGPDDEGVFISGPFALAFRRLSIIDLSGGHQPLFNEDDSIALVFNGEIYNFRELRADLEAKGHRFKTKSDSEVLLHLYEEHGDDLVQHLVGMFAFALLDQRERSSPRLLLGRDRLGIKPLYYAERPEGLYFASEPKAILAFEATPRRFRAAKLLEYLVQGYTGGPDSAWEGIARLPPGHVLSFSAREGVRVRRYWDLPTDSLREPATAEEILEWLDRAVACRMIADVPLGAFLSGGIDSTAVVTSMVRASREPVIACSVGFGEKSHDELDVARASALELGLRHHTAVLTPDPALAIDKLPWFFDEPLADPSTVPTWLVSRMAREHVTVALSGDGGDETFAGYRRYVHDVAENRLRARLGPVGQAAFRAAGRTYPKLDWAPRFLRAQTFLTNVGEDAAHAYWRSVTQLSREAALELLAAPLRAELADVDPFDAFEQHYRRPAVDDALYRAQYADFHTYLPDQILAKVDRASMAVSLEARVPILDHRIVGRFANLPPGEKVRGGRGKHAFREALRGRVRDEVLDGPKRGFDTPLRSWLRGPLSQAVAEAIETLPAGWFDRETLRARAAQHASGRSDHSRLLWSLLVLEHWRRRHAVADLAV